MLVEIFLRVILNEVKGFIYKKPRFFASLRMTTKVKRFMTHYTSKRSDGVLEYRGEGEIHDSNSPSLPSSI
ncbi:MAG: hypothetical protein ACREQV_22885, partial [Candidatus Binatia bacterium]